jgi:senataxin
VARAIVTEAHVVCTTLACAATREVAMLGARGFDAVVVDEACQATETSTLIPLGHNCRRLVLLGDPQQLPPTVLSQRAERAGFGRSLFERLVAAGVPVCFLSTQYRMHPTLCAFPSEHFYGGRLVTAGAEEAEWPLRGHPAFQPVTFFDVTPRFLPSTRQLRSDGAPEADVRALLARAQHFCAPRGQSYGNAVEAQLVAALCAELRSARAAAAATVHVSVLTPYSGQVDEIRRALSADDPVRVSTVDSFQGQEQDVIVISCVRASAGEMDGGAREPSGIGFLSDPRRMNVAITRARDALVVVGDAMWLSRHSRHWAAFVAFCAQRGRIVPACPGWGPWPAAVGVQGPHAPASTSEAAFASLGTRLRSGAHPVWASERRGQ